MADAASLWSRYVSWLATHAPASHANLAAPASEESIAEVERVTGASLPDDLKAVWRANDGQRRSLVVKRKEPGTPTIPTLTFLSTALVVDVWRTWAELDVDEELQASGSSPLPGVVLPRYTHPGWIPLWADPTRSDYVGLDLAPGERGLVGQIINFGRDEERHLPFAESFAHLLGILVEEVEAGRWPASEIGYGKETLPWLGAPGSHFFNTLRERVEARHPEAKPPLTRSQQISAALAEGSAALRERDFARARACVATADALAPGGTRAAELSIRILAAEGDAEGATRALDELLARAPKYPQADSLRAAIAKARGA